MIMMVVVVVVVVVMMMMYGHKKIRVNRYVYVVSSSPQLMMKAVEI